VCCIDGAGSRINWKQERQPKRKNKVADSVSLLLGSTFTHEGAFLVLVPLQHKCSISSKREQITPSGLVMPFKASCMHQGTFMAQPYSRSILWTWSRSKRTDLLALQNEQAREQPPCNRLKEQRSCKGIRLQTAERGFKEIHDSLQ
jgi:hypothetical protein